MVLICGLLLNAFQTAVKQLRNEFVLMYLSFLYTQNIDFVLAYFEAEQGKENDEKEKEKAEMREKFEENLVKQGLLLERVNSTGKEACNPPFVD